MPSFTFDAPEGHKLEVDGEIIATGGQEFSCSQEVAERLVASGVSLGNSGVVLEKLSRAALEDLAKEKGFDPSAYRNKTELIEALEQPIADHLSVDDQPPANPQD